MWCILNDPCGLACYIFGWMTVLFVDYVLITECVWPWLGGHWSGLFHVAFFQTLIALICGAYFRAATTDPGSVQPHTASRAVLYAPEDDPQRPYKPRRRYCDKCECIKPPRAHHCSTCKRCINKMDHHCPWVNNCVGSNNMKFFLQFLLYVFLGGVYTVLMFVSRFVACWRAPHSCPEPGLQTIITSVVATILGIFFAIFTAAMFFDQHEGLTTNTTGIESMKGWSEEPRTLRAGLREACGEPFGWRWFAPVPLHQTGGGGPGGSGPSNFYAWQPSDDPDSYDPRDPMVLKHFRRIEAFLTQHALKQTAEEAEADRLCAVSAAAEIHRRHAIKKPGHKPAPPPPGVVAGEEEARLAAQAGPRGSAVAPDVGWMPREPLSSQPGSKGAAGTSAHGGPDHAHNQSQRCVEGNDDDVDAGDLDDDEGDEDDVYGDGAGAPAASAPVASGSLSRGPVTSAPAATVAPAAPHAATTIAAVRRPGKVPKAGSK